MNNNREVKKGIYQHFRGNLYEVLGIARDSETNVEMVVYKALYDNPKKSIKHGDWFVRPKGMFLEDKVLPDGKSVPRFKFVKEGS